MSEKPIYLDYNATTPVDPRVVDAMLPYLYEKFGNPSSSHAYGAEAKLGVEKARREIADMLGCKSEEIIFTSGGSEANNLAIKGTAFANRSRGNHIITSAIEHPAVLEVCAYLETQGFKVTYLPVDEFGMVDPADVESAITPTTILVSIMHANNEVGTIQPIEAISSIAHSHNIVMHTDAAQSVGKILVRVDELGIDLLSIAGHKVYAPKGIGALYIRTGIELNKQIHGATHENNIRAGTENVLEIVGLGKACALVTESLESFSNQLRDSRDLLEQGINTSFPWVKVNGHPKNRLPNTSSISFRGLEANTILSELVNVAASAGAACHAEHVDVSHVLRAMQVPVEFAMGTIRFSVGRNTTKEEITRALEEISAVIQRLNSNENIVPSLSDREQIRLTQFTHGLGCACKLRPQLLEEVLKDMPIPKDHRILVGTETADDAAVYLISPDKAIVQTVDFFTPIVDDPYQFGAISAANSLSDIYAMGAQPLFALSIVGFPSSRLPLTVLKEILKGASDKASEAGISIIGGHTVDDTEPKFGLAVTGEVHPDKIWTNAKAQEGDALVLSKPIGTGILTTALKQGLLDENAAQQVISRMAELNKETAEAAREFDVHACTDITGFGLLGHLLGMMKGSGKTAEIQLANIPMLDHAYDLAAGGTIPGGTRSNMDYTAREIDYSSNISYVNKALLNDAQTSGGLLLSLPKSQAALLIEKLNTLGKTAFLIGYVIKQQDKKILVK
jgi:cysteine desulfurase NifS/selenium donor protein